MREGEKKKGGGWDRGWDRSEDSEGNYHIHEQHKFLWAYGRNGYIHDE